MLVGVDSDSVSMEVANVLQLQGVVDLPEGLIVVFEQTIFYHLGLVFVLNMTHDFT